MFVNDDEQKQRMKQLILLGKQRGYVTHAEILDAFPAPDLSRPRWSSNYTYQGPIRIDVETIESIASTLRDIGIEVHSQEPQV